MTGEIRTQMGCVRQTATFVHKVTNSKKTGLQRPCENIVQSGEDLLSETLEFEHFVQSGQTSLFGTLEFEHIVQSGQASLFGTLEFEHIVQSGQTSLFGTLEFEHIVQSGQTSLFGTLTDICITVYCKRLCMCVCDHLYRLQIAKS